MESRSSGPPAEERIWQGSSRAASTLREDPASFLRVLLASPSLIVFGLDTEERVIALSAGLEALLGCEAQAVLGQRLREMLAEDAPWRTALQELEEQTEAERRLGLLDSLGRTVRCQIAVSSWFGEDGGRLGYVVVGRDLSAWERFEDDLVRIDRLAEMGRLSAGVVHDLKNPLSIINQASGWAGVVLQDAKGLGEEDRAELSRTLKEIDEQTARCRRITDQILEFVRESKPDVTGFDLREFVEATIRYLEPEINDPPIEMVFFGFEASPSLQVETDYKLLQQVLVNLLSNAVYAIREQSGRKGRIELRAESRAERVVLAIADNGPGIRPEVQERIFELFYTTKPVGKGTGLGLPICRKIMHRLGGELTFESREGQGTTFFLDIPRKLGGSERRAAAGP